jgi:cysteine desulfurase
MAEGVLDAMRPWLEAGAAFNASSVHRAGQKARAAVESARETVAATLGAHPSEIVFTSGATEADALAVHGTLDGKPPHLALVTQSAEHAAVLAAADRQEALGRRVVRLAPGTAGVPSVQAVEAALEAEAQVALVSVMHTNNETGVQADVSALAAASHHHGALFMTDAVQAYGVTPLRVTELGADLLTLSAHKIGGPQGIGALYVRDGVDLVPQQAGGAQERGLRGGTLPVALAAGFAAAAAAQHATLEATEAHLRHLQARLRQQLGRVEGVRINGQDLGPKHVNVTVPGVDGEALHFALDAAGVEVSAGSACSAGSLEPSHVLTAMGLTASEALASVRFSFGVSTTKADIDEAAQRFAAVVNRLRDLT